MKGFVNQGCSQRERSRLYGDAAVSGGQRWAEDPAAQGMGLLLASLFDESLIKA